MGLQLELQTLAREIQRPFEQIAKLFPLGPEDLRNNAVTDVKLAIKIIRGEVSAAGAVVKGTGFTSAKNSTGNYTVTFTTAFASAPVVLVTAGAWNAGVVVAKINSAQPATTGLVGVVTFNAGVASDEVFDFIAISV